MEYQIRMGDGRVAEIAFQACAFIRLRSPLSSARATARCPAEAA